MNAIVRCGPFTKKRYVSVNLCRKKCHFALFDPLPLASFPLAAIPEFRMHVQPKKTEPTVNIRTKIRLSLITTKNMHMPGILAMFSLAVETMKLAATPFNLVTRVLNKKLDSPFSKK